MLPDGGERPLDEEDHPGFPTVEALIRALPALMYSARADVPISYRIEKRYGGSRVGRSRSFGTRGEAIANYFHLRTFAPPQQQT